MGFLATGIASGGGRDGTRGSSGRSSCSARSGLRLDEATRHALLGVGKRLPALFS